jgi:hypothetical protein
MATCKRTVDRGAEEELGKTGVGGDDETGETGEEGVSIETLEHVMDCLERTTNERVVDPFDDDEVVEGIAVLYD